jgi:hypothetical protein
LRANILGYMVIDGSVSIEHREIGAIIHPNQADVVIKYLKEHPDLELDFSNKYGYMEENPFAVTPSSFSSWGLSDEFDIKVSYIYNMI